MAIIIPANSAADTGYDVANSCRFNDGDTAYMHKTMGTPSDIEIFTWSAWIKRGVITQNSQLFSYEAGSSANRQFIRFNSADQFEHALTVSSTLSQQITNRKFRDCSAWYHIVVAVDTNQGTAANRVKIYVNGVQESSFSTETYPAQYLDTIINTSGNKPSVGASWDGSTPEAHFDGYMAEVYFIDGTQYAASDFGEFDEDSPTIWKPKDASGLTFGTNGFYLDFEDSSNLGNDKNGGTDLTEVNLAAVDQSLDSPTNNFATLNPLMITATNGTISEGNTTWTRSGNWVSIPANFGMTAGKWYWEVRGTSSSGDVSQATGIALGPTTATQTMADWNSTNVHLGDSNQPDSYGHWSTGTLTRRYNNNTNSTYGAGTGASTVIIQVAFDADNGTIWIGKDGTWMDSATQGEIEAGTTTNAMYSGITVNNSNPYFPAVSCENNSAAFNFGGGAFGGTAISSGNADGNGYGNFEFAPPSGYLALCTKNLGSDGG